jgi:hypothetical protein
MRAAVDGHFMTARDEPRGEMLSEGFKPAVAGWNTSSSQDSDAHFIERLRKGMTSARLVRRPSMFAGRYLANQIVQPFFGP